MTTEQLTSGHNLTSLQTFLLTEEQKHPHATGSFTMVLSALSLAAKFIAARCRRARLEDVLGSMDADNIQGEEQQKLDVIANEALIRSLGSRRGVAVIASEEDEKPIILSGDTSGERPYVVLFDPLDGSSNLDVCGGVGTIFSILHHDRRVTDLGDSALQRVSTRWPRIRAVRPVDRPGHDDGKRRPDVRPGSRDRLVHSRRRGRAHPDHRQVVLAQLS